MSNLLLWAVLIAVVACVGFLMYKYIKKTKTGEVIKDAQLEAIGLGDKNVAP